jgi:dTMP kinase
MSKKSIIVFEGIEGTGKSHHINKVVKYLKKNNKKYIQIREPGGSKNSEKIRKLILNNKSTFNRYTDLLLYLSARSENIELIKKKYGKKNYIN